jgi:hypothetical protein
VRLNRLPYVEFLTGAFFTVNCNRNFHLTARRTVVKETDVFFTAWIEIRGRLLGEVRAVAADVVALCPLILAVSRANKNLRRRAYFLIKRKFLNIQDQRQP